MESEILSFTETSVYGNNTESKKTKVISISKQHKNND